MKQISKSLSALDRAFAKLGREGLEAIIAKVDSLDIKGPTIGEYFSNFEDHYRHFFDNVCELVASATEGSTYKFNKFYQHKIDIVVLHSDIEWSDPERKDLNQNNLTTVENYGGFLFPLLYERNTASKICFS